MDFPRIDDQLSMIRTNLGEPRPNKPSLRLTLEKLYYRNNQMAVQASLVNQGWAVRSFPFALNYQDTDILLPTPADFGRVLRVTTEAADCDCSYFPYGEASLDLHNLENLAPTVGTNTFWRGFWADRSECASWLAPFPRLALYHSSSENGNRQWRLKAWPKALRRLNLLCWYTVTNPLAVATLDTHPIFQEFLHLPALKAALDLAPFTEWEGSTVREEVAISLKAQIDEHNADFQAHVRKLRAPVQSSAQLWGMESERGGYGYGY